jgi:ribosome-binding ATPase YchF (GTP1/OBG family)
MKIGIVGYQGSGKSTLFEWLTGTPSDPAQAHASQSAMAPIPDERVDPLCEIYHPKKITLASIELVDTPGLDRSHEGNAARLGLLREADCLLIVASSYDGSDPLVDLQNFDEDLLLADLEIVTGRVERLRETVKKPRPDRKEQQEELAALEPLLDTLEEGTPLREIELTDQQIKATRAFRLLSRLPRIAVVNVADDDEDTGRFEGAGPEGVPLLAVPVGLELELSKMSDEDREAFESEMGLEGFDRDSLIRKILAASAQMIYFTAGEKEVRTWILPIGGTAVEAAGNIHTDLARGFIRAEIMCSEDLIRLGSEREIKAQSLMRQEPKDYVVQDGDVMLIRFSV